MHTAQVLQFPALAVARTPAFEPRVVLMHADQVFEYDTIGDLEGELQALLIREGWTPPPEAVADASSPPEPAPAPVAARPWPPVQDFLIVALGLAAVFLALAAGL
jgi:hypothetical protein